MSRWTFIPFLLGSAVIGNYLYWFLESVGVFRKKK